MFKRLSKGLLAGLLMTLILGIHAYALGNGEVQFSDPTTKVGHEVEVTAKMTAGGGLIGDGELVLQYDPDYLEFVEGTGSKDASEGTVTVFNAGTGTETELDYSIKFKAKKEGETEITVSESTSYMWDNSNLQLTLGSSKVKIEAGDGTEGSDSGLMGTGPEVTINERKWKIVNEIPESMIPEGFAEIDMNFSGEKVKAIQQDSSGQQALYLTDGREEKLFLYDADNGSFSPFELIDVSDKAYIILLQDDESVEIPKSFQPAKFTCNEQQFPAWQHKQETEYYLIYGLNKGGEKALYLYDSQDETYQKFAPNLLTKTEARKAAKKTPRSGFLGKVLDFTENHLKPVLIGLLGLLLLLFIITLVQKHKIHVREVEIDDLFDELDGKKPGVKSSRKYDDYDYYDDDFSGTLPMEEELFADDEYDDYDLEYNYGDDDELIENATGAIEPQRLTDTLANHKPIDPDAPVRPKRPRTRSEGVNQKFHVENDDDFKMDFIDLDD